MAAQYNTTLDTVKNSTLESSRIKGATKPLAPPKVQSDALKQAMVDRMQNMMMKRGVK